jgi:hypothetical protein
MSGEAVQNFCGVLNMSIKHNFAPIVNGKLTQIGAAFRSSREYVKSAVFKCECGSNIVTMVRLVAIGTTKTCGKCCVAVRNGDTWNKKRSRAYIAWINMRQRCLNPRNKDFVNYGARGITICDRWKLFANFLLDMGQPPKGLSIDRIDNNAGYSADNCRWATKRQQLLNRRTCIGTHRTE